MLLGPGCGHHAKAEVTSRERCDRSRSPPTRHRSGSSKGQRHRTARQVTKKNSSKDRVAAAPAPPAQPSTDTLSDGIDHFFANAKKPLAAIGSASANDTLLDAEIEATLASPLEFSDKTKRPEEDALTVIPDFFGPTLSGPSCNPASFNCRTPTAATTMEVQLGEITE